MNDKGHDVVCSASLSRLKVTVCLVCMFYPQNLTAIVRHN